MSRVQGQQVFRARFSGGRAGHEARQAFGGGEFTGGTGARQASALFRTSSQPAAPPSCGAVKPIVCLGRHLILSAAISAPEIRAAMERLVHPNQCEALAVDARQELDLKVVLQAVLWHTDA